MKFPRDIPKNKFIKVLENLGFKVVRIGNHISMLKNNLDGSRTPLTMPNHNKIKASTLITICRQSNIPREEFLNIYKKL